MRRLVIAASLAVSSAAGIGLTVAYVFDADNWVLGVLLALALVGIGIAIVGWSFTLIGGDNVEERHPFEEEDLDEAAQVRTSGGPSRRTFIGLLGAAVTFLLVAIAAPFRSLDPGKGPELFHTKWSKGARLIDIDGNPVKAGDLDIGGVVTVFPEGYPGDGQSQALLLRVDPDQYEDPEGRRGWAPEGHLVYSKVCTHAGCPIGLYEERDQLLLCPCHQSTFEVMEEAKPVFGPAPRPLPQLPIEIDSNGWLIAQSDFLEPVGPGFWNRDR